MSANHEPFMELVGGRGEFPEAVWSNGGMCPGCGGFSANWSAGTYWECDECRIILRNETDAEYRRRWRRDPNARPRGRSPEDWAEILQRYDHIEAQ